MNLIYDEATQAAMRTAAERGRLPDQWAGLSESWQCGVGTMGLHVVSECSAFVI